MSACVNYLTHHETNITLDTTLGPNRWVLKRATRMIDNDGKVKAIDDQASEMLNNTITEMAKRGLRCICLTYTEYSLSDPDR